MLQWFSRLFSRQPPDKSASAAILTQSPGGLGVFVPSLNRAQEQYRHHVGWPAVAVRAIAWRVAGQDLHVAKFSRRRSRKAIHGLPRHLKAMGDSLAPLDSHPLLDAVQEPNPVMTRFSLLVSTVGSLELTGRSHWWLPDSDNGGVEIWPLPSSWVEANDPLRGSYTIRPKYTGQSFKVDASEMATFLLPDPSDPFGAKSPLQSQAPAIAADESIQTAQARAFQNGLFPGLLIRVGKNPSIDGVDGGRPTLTKTQRKDLIESLRATHESAINYGEPLILDGTIEGVDRLTNKPSEMDFLESGKSTKSRIMQAFGVNPSVVGQLENANRAAAYVAEKSFVQNTVNPLLQLLSEAMTRWVCPRFASDGERLVAWIEPAVADDAEMDLQKWGLALKTGTCSTNEFRAHVLNAPPVEGGDEMANSAEARVWRSMGGHI